MKRKGTQSPDPAVLAMQEKFVALCVMATPPSIVAKRIRELGAPEDFVRLCRHPLVTKVFIEGQTLIVGTKVLSICGKPIGAYAISITLGNDPIVSCFNVTTTVIRNDGYVLHGPHVLGANAEICMGSQHWKEIMFYIKQGKLTEVIFFLIDALQQSTGHPFIPVEMWPKIEIGDI